MKKFTLVLASIFLICVSASADPSSFLSAPLQGKLAMQNRVLTRVGDKTITAYDVMQKMAFFLQRNYPKEAQSPLARSQFFISNWRNVLIEMINQELILADALHLEIKISDKEVREEMLARFGPNVMHTLDAIGIPFEKAKQLTYNEMAIERMQWYRVHSKAQEMITPRHIKEAYKSYLAANPQTTELEYQVLTIRSSDREAAQALAEKAHSLLSEGQATFTDLPKQLPETEGVTTTLSDTYKVKRHELSKAHRSALSSLTPGTFSKPSSQVSRFDKSEAFRIFFLNSAIENKPRSFEEMENELRQQLFGQAVSIKTDEYVAKLRKQYGYDDKTLEELIPENFQPFSIQ